MIVRGSPYQWIPTISAHRQRIAGFALLGGLAEMASELDPFYVLMWCMRIDWHAGLAPAYRRRAGVRRSRCLPRTNLTLVKACFMHIT